MTDPEIEALVLRYGDLIFDLCQSIFQSEQNSQILLRDVFAEVRKSRPEQRFERYERAWVLHIACEKIRKAAATHAARLSATEQLELDSATDTPGRFSRFDLCLRRLPVEDQIVLLLKDKYGLSLREISAVLGRSEDSLKLQRAQALRSLEEWIWE